jgi:hypothetical protein
MNNYVQAAKAELNAIRQELADRFGEDFDWEHIQEEDARALAELEQRMHDLTCTYIKDPRLLPYLRMFMVDFVSNDETGAEISDADIESPEAVSDTISRISGSLGMQVEKFIKSMDIDMSDRGASPNGWHIGCLVTADQAWLLAS